MAVERRQLAPQTAQIEDRVDFSQQMAIDGLVSGL